MIGVAFGTMALVIVLSVFNGLEDFIRKLYSSFDPELKIHAAVGKSFLLEDFPSKEILKIDAVAGITEIIEESAYIKHKTAEMVVTLKGVSSQFIKDGRLKENLVEGKLVLTEGKTEFAIMGRGVQNTLDIVSLEDINPIQVYYPRRNANMLDPLNSVNHQMIFAGGVFAIEKQFDMNFMITSIRFAENLFDYKGRRTGMEITLVENGNAAEVKKQLAAILGDKYKILTRDEQHSSLIRAIKWEKLFVYLTFSFIIAVSAINIFFSLTMLALDKRKDIAILRAMGSDRQTIRNIFFKEGAIIGFTGAGTGLILGIIVCLIQQKFGLISLGIETSVISAYPVMMKPLDFVFAAFSIILITVVFSIRPAVLAARLSIIQYIS